jgi:hypothetical protein
MEIGPVQILAGDVENREWLSIDLDGDLFPSGGELYLPPNRECGAE